MKLDEKGDKGFSSRPIYAQPGIFGASANVAIEACGDLRVIQENLNTLPTDTEEEKLKVKILGEALASIAYARAVSIAGLDKGQPEQHGNLLEKVTTNIKNAVATALQKSVAEIVAVTQPANNLAQHLVQLDQAA